MNSSLVNRNVVVNGRRTSVRLEPQMWDALREIARREGRTMHDVCSEVEATRRTSTLTAGLRVFILSYFREAATTEGHVRAGHGDRLWIEEAHA
ncbi:MAG: ribbon-helix-helix domain-containing protein [Alphaproteobacteria bacterium]